MSESARRQIVLDTETTGLDPQQGHRIIEIGCVELVERRLTGNNFHIYLNPDRVIDAAAIEVHGITNEMVADKPRFGDIVEDLMAYLRDAELIIHNAPFDVGFLDKELEDVEAKQRIADISKVTDSLLLARKKHPGQRNTLDALCTRYDVDNSRRDKHGALLDAEILADVYLAMTGGQRVLMLDSENDMIDQQAGTQQQFALDRSTLKLLVRAASDDELAAHEACLDSIEKRSGATPVWRRQV